MEAPIETVDADMAAMTIAGSNMESAVAQLKRLQSESAQGASSFMEPTLPSKNHVRINTVTQVNPGSSIGPLLQEDFPARASQGETQSLLQASVGMVLNGHSSETVDLGFGESLPDADVPKQMAHRSSLASALCPAINAGRHHDDSASRPQQNTPVALSSAGKRRGRPPGSRNKRRPAIPSLLNNSHGNQYEFLPSPIGEKIINKDATPDQRSRSANISEAMKVSWARRRKKDLGNSRQGPMSEKSVTKKKSDQDFSGQRQTNGVRLSYEGPQRQLFKGQHAIRSGSGHKLPGSELKRPSAIGGSKNHPALHQVIRAIPSADELARLPDTSGGPEADDPPSICKGDNGLIRIFRTCVHPAAVAAINRYRDTVLSPELLSAICKQVAKETINEKFVNFLQRTEYKLDRAQKKLVRKFVKQSFAAAAKLGIESIQNRTFKAQSIQPKSETDLTPLFDANRIEAHSHGDAINTGRPILDEPEPAHSHTDPGKALDPNNTIYEVYEAEKQSEPANENGALSGHTESAESSSLVRPSVEFLSGNQDSSTTDQGQSVDHEVDQGKELSCEKRFGSASSSQGPSIMAQSGYSDVDWDSTLCRQHGPKPLSLWKSNCPSMLRPQSAFNPKLELAMARATINDSGVNRPYKSLRRGHVDFVSEECVSILRTLDRLDQVPVNTYPADTSDLYQQIKARLGVLSQERLTATVKAVSSELETTSNRKKKSIRAFLLDLVNNSIPFYAQPKFAKPRVRVGTEVKDSKGTLHSLLRNREFGIEGKRLSVVCKAYTHPPYSGLQDVLGATIVEDIRPWKSWKGASSDVVNVAWAPDSLSYAAGAAAQSDDNDLQYNRPNNLLFGQLRSNTISELPDHYIARPRPETIPSGPNSNQAVYDACDPKVYKTVTSVHFSPWGGLLYTASQDRTAKIWDVSGTGLPSCICTLPHNAEVTSLEVSSHYPQVFATAAKSVDDSIRVYQPPQEEPPTGVSPVGYQFTTFSSARALKHRDQYIFPECLRWGLAPGSQHLLLGGFQQWAEQDFSAARQGQICLWDVYTGTSIPVRPHVSAIFAAAWHPRENIFITGGAPGTGTLSYPRVTQSVLRMYDPRHTTTYTAEFECPALDMQDVTFHPSSSYVTAGCTDGTTYVWDRRIPDHILHRLEHGYPLQELAANEEKLPYMKHRERVDAGVMLSIWGHGASLFYTGSSDGIVKAWDVLRAPEDVWVKDVAELPAGVQSGALSPDGMNMLVGDAVGGVHVLSAAPLGYSSGTLDNQSAGYHPDPITFVAATNHRTSPIEEEGTEGIDEGNELLRLRQLVVHPSLGVGKGPNYGQSGYFAHYARWQNDTTGYWELCPGYDRKQAFSIDGVEQAERSAKIQDVVLARREQIKAKRKFKPLVVSFGSPTPFVANRRSGGTSHANPPDISNSTRISTSNQSSSPDPLKAVSSTLKPSSVRTSKSQTASPKTSSSSKLSTSNFIDLDTYVSPSRISSNKRRRDSNDSSPSKSPVKRLKWEHYFSANPKVPKFSPAETVVVDLTGDDLDVPDVSTTTKSEREIPKLLVVEEGEEEENLLSYEEWAEEDHWWPE
ncbi:MAG: hypothetical protein Q9171_002363 [Xanthocarpia ochracea]